MAGSNLAPSPQFPERAGNIYERKVVPATPGERGPLRFEEGIGSDTDVPNEFHTGAMQGYETPAGRSNHNKNVYEKPAAETMKERAHIGSASWVEAPEYLSSFASNAFGDHSVIKYEEVTRDGSHQKRLNAAAVND